MKAIISLAILLMATLTAWADSAKDRWTIYPSYSNITEIEPVGNICLCSPRGQYSPTTSRTEMCKRTTKQA